MQKISLWATLVLLLFSINGMAQNFPEKSNPPRLVNDFAGFLSPAEQQALEQKLEAFEKQTSTQIAVVTVNSLDGMDPSQYAGQLFDKWGIGQKGKDNGALILIKPKKGNEQGQVFIATGYGIEGAVPDALAGRIVDYDILPAFREGKNYQGVDQAVKTLISLTKGEFTADQYLKKKQRTSALSILFPILLLGLFVALSVRRKSGYSVSSSQGGSAIPPVILMGGIPFLGGSSHHGSGGFGGFSGGGGGFGGFGGGFSGGGGAGGSW